MYAHYNSVVASYRKPNAFYGVSSFDYLKNDDNNNKYHCDRDGKNLTKRRRLDRRRTCLWDNG